MITAAAAAATNTTNTITALAARRHTKNGAQAGFLTLRIKGACELGGAN